VTLSDRVPVGVEANALTRLLAERRAAGAAVVDLTESNPTRAGLSYPPDLLAPLGDPSGLRYAPEALGLRAAREAVARDARRRGAMVSPDQVVLAASTSEMYSWLFKLLCGAGDSILVPQPSYPLFEHLTRLEHVRAVPYRLEYHGRWSVDLASVEQAPATTRAVLIVSPNNPTGSFVTPHDLAGLRRVCRARGWALIVDEVFADYAVDAVSPITDIAASAGDVLTFSLGGLSKAVGLPQVKLGWAVTGGPAGDVRQALEGLELIADTFLSVSTPVQLAADALLRDGAAVRAAIQARVRANLDVLRTTVRDVPSCDLLPVDGGWSAVLRVPATRSEDTLVLDLLAREGILVHPGYFFDFDHEAFLVLSLLPPPDVFADACARVLRFVSA
jgi:aspartate/methionine/tyrosine aminotransferase